MAHYARVTVRPVSRTTQALKLFSVEFEDIQWVPRSCIADEGASIDAAMDSDVLMPNVDIEIKEWKAEELGWY